MLTSRSGGSERLVIAQAGGFERLPASVAPTPYSPDPSSTNKNAPSLPHVDFVPNPNVNPGPSDRNQGGSDRSTDRSTGSTDDPTRTTVTWGALAFTADGSYSSTWKMPSQPDAEAKVLRQCARFGRGGCEVVSFSGQQCVALSTFIGPYRRKRWNLSFTAGGMTYPEAQNAALGRCNSDERTQGRCQPRTAACADGR